LYHYKGLSGQEKALRLLPEFCTSTTVGGFHINITPTSH